ncbi:MAG: hypothetical protein K2N87_07455 [Eubacterium sp.]|nr:hypothetical protein [Eubacterium sp.]
MDMKKVYEKKYMRCFLIVGIFLAAAAAVCIYVVNRNRYDFDKSFFQIIDQYDTRSYTAEELREIYARDHFLEDLVNFNEELNRQQEGFQFVEIDIQPIELIGHWDKPASLVNGYGHKDLRNQKVQYEGKEIEITPVDCFQVGKQSQFSLFGKEIFQEDAFVQQGDVVLLMLGSGFQGYYKTGDTIRFIYLNKTWTGKVAGFLENETKIAMDDFFVYELDHAMVMPFFSRLDINTETETDTDAGAYFDRDFQIDYFFRKNAGYLKMQNKEAYKEGRRLIEKLAEKYRLDYTLLRGY